MDCDGVEGKEQAGEREVSVRCGFVEDHIFMLVSAKLNKNAGKRQKPRKCRLGAWASAT